MDIFFFCTGKIFKYGVSCSLYLQVSQILLSLWSLEGCLSENPEAFALVKVSTPAWK